MPKSDVPTEGGYWHEDHSAPKRESAAQKESWYNIVGQKLLGWSSPAKNHMSKEPAVTIYRRFISIVRHSLRVRMGEPIQDTLIVPLHFSIASGALALGLYNCLLLIPKKVGSIITFNRLYDHNTAPVGAWHSNYTIANGSVVTTDGATRDRMVWRGDMMIAVPGIAVSTYDMLAVRDALDTIYDHQYGGGSMPYAGPSMGGLAEFSDTYHLHALVGTYYYVLYSGDLEWLKKRWNAYTSALAISIAKVDEFNLLHVSSVFDWIRPGMTGHNVEASSILYEVLGNSIKLASWLGERSKTSGVSWDTTRTRLTKGISTLYCTDDGPFPDNIRRHGIFSYET